MASDDQRAFYGKVFLARWIFCFSASIYNKDRGGVFLRRVLGKSEGEFSRGKDLYKKGGKGVDFEKGVLIFARICSRMDIRSDFQ